MRAVGLVIGCILCWTLPAAKAAEPLVIPLWPGVAPGETGEIGEERETTKPTDGKIAGREVSRIGFVSRPTLTIYRASVETATGTAVMVCPGGGYHILAWDLEGTEVCEWLNSIGVTAALLKYRVPRRDGREPHAPALQDAQRAMGLLRQRSGELGIDADRIGALGFSAGAHLAAALSTAAESRTYEANGDADQFSSRPDFAVLVYPGGLTKRDQPKSLAESVTVSEQTPPTFLTMAQDDPVGIHNVFTYAEALQGSKVPLEVHVYPTGGHGYGLRRTEAPATTWPDRAAEWMKSRGWLTRPE